MPVPFPDGAARMQAWAAEIPNQLEQGFAAGRELTAQIPRDARSIVFAGMGGSGIAGDLLASLAEHETDIATSSLHGPTLPRSVGARSLVVLVSYSGSTWETLAAYDDAARRHAARLTVGSGGELARRAEADGVPHLLVPPGLPPRAAIGQLFGGLLGSLDSFFPESNESRLHRATGLLRDFLASNSGRRGAPAGLAQWIGARTVAVYADDIWQPVAHRWATQLNENAKRLATSDQLPEVFHNALVAWDALGPAEARRWAVLLLRHVLQNPLLEPGLDRFAAQLRRRQVRVRTVAFDAADPLAAMLLGIAYGDQLSLQVASIARVDPLPIPALDRFKRGPPRHARRLPH